MNHAKSFLIGTFLAVALSVTAQAQTLKWEYVLPYPSNFDHAGLLDSVWAMRGQQQNINLTDFPLSPYIFFANDGSGGTVWLMSLEVNSDRREANGNGETNCLMNRLVWLNNHGKPILTNDYYGPVTENGCSLVGARIVRFSSSQVALQIRTEAANGDAQGRTNFLRRITRLGFKQHDTPLLLDEEIPMETRTTTDRYGFFSFTQRWVNITNDIYRTDFVVRRFSN